MGIARALTRRPEFEERSQWQSWWNLAGAPGLISAGAYGQTAIEQTLRNAAGWACIDFIADAIGRTPMDAFRGSGPGAVTVSPTPAVLGQPSGLVECDVWRYQLGFSQATDGNAFGRITSMSRQAYPQTIELLSASSVTQRKVEKGVKVVTIDNKQESCWPFGEIWHVPGRMVPAGSPWGLSPVEYAARTTGTSLSAEDFSYQFFTDGAHPTAAVYSSKDLTFEQAKVIKEAIRQATTGNREALVMGSDLKWEQIQTNPSDSQFLDTMRFCVEQACRVWHVPPSMIFAAISGQNVTYSSVSDADLFAMKHTLDGYYVRFENAMTAILPRPQYVKANRDAVLRADPMSRYQVHEIAIRNRLRTPNEARALEDESPLDDGTGDLFYGPVAPGRAEPQVPGDAPATVSSPTTQPVVPSGNGKGSAK